MKPEIFAEWMRRQGHKVIRSQSSYWYSAGPRVFQAFPYHWKITPNQNEIKGLMRRHGVLALRYSAPLEYPKGMASYHVVLRPPYSLDGLRSQARNGIKQGLKHFEIRQITFERLATEGWLLQKDTLERQGRLESMAQTEWENMCRSAIDLQGFEAWAAIHGEELAAALIICRIDDVFNVPYALSHRKFLRKHVNNALFFKASCEMLARERIREIFFTVQSLDAPPSVDEFKFRMGLIPVVVRQHVAFHPILQPFAQSGALRLTDFLLQRDGNSPFLAKAEGMLRFHIAGKKPLTQQDWPMCLSDEKEKILAALGERSI